VVLHLGEQDFVAALDELGAPRRGDEVDASVVPRVKMISSALRALRNFAARTRAASNAAWRGCLIRGGAMDVGVVALVVTAQGVDDGARFLLVAALSR